MLGEDNRKLGGNVNQIETYKKKFTIVQSKPT